MSFRIERSRQARAICTAVGFFPCGCLAGKLAAHAGGRSGAGGAIQCRQVFADKCFDLAQGFGAHIAHARAHARADFFKADDALSLVDMPGNGYAEAPKISSLRGRI